MISHRIWITSDSGSIFGLDVDRTCFAIYPNPEDFDPGYWGLDDCSLERFINTMSSIVLDNKERIGNEEF